jgi:lipopolysaccharide/colanic/teichoic acid biosynthesis glycosyltransferase
MTIMQEAEAVGLRPAEFTSPSRTKKVAAGPLIDAKRIMDIFGAGLCLILCAPVMIIIFTCLLFSGRPVFAQRRVGRGGKLFFCYKFRTMVKDADRVLADYLQHNQQASEEWARAYKLADDPRVTPIGRFLRKSSLDELPQLFNVLRGDMSLVGPRPIVPGEVPRYAGRIGAYNRCRPGITGLWQVSGRNLTSYPRRVALDAVYARKRSVGLDLLILFKTIRVVAAGRGAS